MTVKGKEVQVLLELQGYEVSSACQAAIVQRDIVLHKKQDCALGGHKPASVPFTGFQQVSGPTLQGTRKNTGGSHPEQHGLQPLRTGHLRAVLPSSFSNGPPHPRGGSAVPGEAAVSRPRGVGFHHCCC